MSNYIDAAKKVAFVFFYILAGVSGYLAFTTAVKGHPIGGAIFGLVTLASLGIVKNFRSNDNNGSIEKLEEKLNRDLLAKFKEKHPKVIKRFLLTLLAFGVIGWGYMIYFVLKGD